MKSTFMALATMGAMPGSPAVPTCSHSKNEQWEQVEKAETRMNREFQDSVPTVPTVPTDLNEHREMSPQTVAACRDCEHFAQPGKSDGYCARRNDLPRAYGANHPLRKLPADDGASCNQWILAET